MQMLQRLAQQPANMNVPSPRQAAQHQCVARLSYRTARSKIARQLFGPFESADAGNATEHRQNPQAAQTRNAVQDFGVLISFSGLGHLLVEFLSLLLRKLNWLDQHA